MQDPKHNEEQIELKETSTQQITDDSERIRNDKRYEEPFEDEGAPDDDCD